MNKIRSKPIDLVNEFHECRGNFENQLRALPGMLQAMLTATHEDGTPYWARVDIPESNGTVTRREFKSVKEWCASRCRAGLALSVEKVFTMLDLAKEFVVEAEVEEVQALFAEATKMNGHGEVADRLRSNNGTFTRVDNVNSGDGSKGGNGKAYLERRLARDNPEMLAEIGKGKQFPSVRQAAIAAGIVKVKTPLEQLLHWWEKANTLEREQFQNRITTQ